ncbi:MAG: hypothetical protein ACOY37_07830 [Pseudomonadota bacterium]
MAGERGLLGIWHRLAPVLVALALGATVLAARSRFDDMQALLAGPRLANFLIAFAILAVANVAGALVFVSFTSRSGAVRILGAYLLSQLAKYVPGRIWVVVLQGSLLSRVAPGELLISNVRAVVVITLAVAGAGLAFLVRPHSHMLAGGVFIATWWISTRAGDDQWARALLSLVQAVPRFGRIADALAVSVVDRERRHLRSASLATFLVCYSLGWWLVVRVALPDEDAMLVLATLSFSYLTGVASMLPAGIGAREATMLVLAPWAGASHADMAMLAVVSRSGLLVVDVVSALAGSILLLRTGTGAQK